MGAQDGFDWSWASSTGGKLDRRQMGKLLIAAATLVPGALSSHALSFLGVQGPAVLDEAEMRIPDTAVAKEAEWEARRRLSPWVLEHSYRVYYFGKALAKIGGVPLDEELHFTTAILHDIEFEHPVPGRCFAVRGAEDAERFLTGLGVPRDRVVLVRNGISGHITFGVEKDLSDLAGVVSAGCETDLGGTRVEEMNRKWVDSVVAQHPRLDFKRRVIEAVRLESEAVPDGRTALMRQMGFEMGVTNAPFAE
ncbi:phosphohydrolase [Nocardia sp. NPDC051570]|uniref:phosphohydrolase n=1 Tax=Nocardia sp. NPDC051570 TaxID=3364324 RepID=UPI003788B1FF